MAFDPDEYLNEKGTSSTAKAGFDPDAYLSESEDQDVPFDPETYLAEAEAPARPKPPVGTSIGAELAAIPQALKQAVGQPLEAMGETATVLGAPSVGAALRGAIEEPQGYVPASQRLVQPQEGEFQIAGFAPQYIPRAAVEQAGQIAGAIATSAIGRAVGGLAGSALGPKGTVAGAVAGQFLGPALFEMGQIVGPAARERAANQGREEPNTDDLAWAWGTAAGSGALNAVGAKYLPNGDKLASSLGRRIAESWAAESTTEGAQELLQQVGQTFLTEQGLELKPKEAIGAALVAGPAAAGATVIAAPFTPTPEVKAAAAAETKVAAEQAAPVAPETAQVVSEQANQVISEAQAEETAETPDERVARLQREAQAATDITLEEEAPVSGLPPVEPTPPVTPAPDAAVAPVEPPEIVEVEPAPAEIPPSTEAVPPQLPTVAGFTTAQGSTYEVTPEGKTVRTKVSEGAGQGQTYEPHSVLFVQPEASQSIMADMQSTAGNTATRIGYIQEDRFVPVSDSAQIPADATPTIATVDRRNDQVLNTYTAEREPQVGLSPVEKLYKPDGTSSTHIGNQITEIRPTAEAAPVEPVVPEGGARPATPEIEAIEGESELRKFVRENAETIEDFELVDITRGEGDTAAKELASSLISERAKQRLKTRIDEGKTALLTQTPEGDIFANSSNDESFNLKLDLLPEERRALSAANADREFAETTEEVANANAAIQEAVRPAVERAVAEPVVPTEGAVEPTAAEPAPVAPPRPAVDVEALSPNAKRANRILTNTGIDPETAAFVAQQYQDEIADLGGEELRAFVLDKFEENGGVIPAQMRYSEDQEYYELAFGIGPEEAETLVENAKGQNTQMAQAELEQNKQWRRKDEQITETQQGVAVAQPEAQAVPVPAGEVPPSPAIEGRRVPLAAPEAAVTPTPTPEPPALAPLRRVVKAEQTEEDVSGLVGQGLVELYNGQPVLTQAGLETLPEAERPRLTPEARKIQIDTRTSEAAAEAISKNLRIGVDQVPVDVRMPAGWTIEGDIYIPPVVEAAPVAPTFTKGEMVRVTNRVPTYEGGRVVGGRDELVAGSITRIMPDGKVEVRLQRGGYQTLAPNEVQKIERPAPAPQPEVRESRRAAPVEIQQQYTPKTDEEQQSFDRASTNKILARSPQLAVAAVRMKNGEITAGEYADLVDVLDPFVVKGAEPVPTNEKIYQYMSKTAGAKPDSEQGKKKLAKIGAVIPNGKLAEFRIDIPTYNESTKNGDTVYSITGHEPVSETAKSVGETIAHLGIAKITNPQFITRTISGKGDAVQIAMGAGKFPLATVKGNYEAITELPSDINDPNAWTEAGYNPVRSSELVDVRSKKALVGGTEAIMVGSRVFVKNAQLEARPTGVTMGERYARRATQPTVGMTTDAVRARLEALGFGVEGMIRIVEDPQAAFEGRTIIQDGKAVRIELNASALNDDAAIDRVLNHEFAEAANADGTLNKLVERLTPKEKKEINDAITRLGYEERVRTTEEAARAIEALAAGWKGRGFFERAVARVEAWGSKLGLKLTRRAAEYIAARNLAEVSETVRKWHISDALANLNGARRVTFNGMSAVLIPPSEMQVAYSIAAYHGTPHKIKGGFQLKYVGTGEGATAYGWGLYFAENQQVAEQYRKQLSYKDNKAYQDSQNKPIEELLPVVFAEGNTVNIFGEESKVKSFRISDEDFTVVLEDGRVINKNTLAQSTFNVRSQYMQMFGGNIYSVNLDVNENELLDWDVQISDDQLSRKIYDLTNGRVSPIPFRMGENGEPIFVSGKRLTGREVYELIGVALEKRTPTQVAIQGTGEQKKIASEALLSIGINGIRYLDQGSRVDPKDIAKAAELRTEVAQLTETIAKNEGKEWAERKMFTDWLAASKRDLAAMEKLIEVNKTTYNYVVFDENLIKITGVNGQPVEIRESRREPAPTFTEESPEAKTLSNLKASMAKVDAASEAKGGKPETQKVSEIAANWMESGGDERALQDAIIENTNLSPANAAKVAKVIAKQYGLQQQIAETGAVIAEIAPEPEGAPRKSSVTKLIEQTTGVRKPVVKLQVSESAALKKQIQLKAREARETRKARKEAAEELAKAITDYVKANPIRGPINSRQAMSITKRALKLDVNNEAAVDRFEMYVERVIENANYDRDLADARALIKRAKTFAKSKDTQGNVKTTLDAIANISPTLLDNPFEFNLVVQRYLLGLAPVTAKQYAVMPDADVRRYLESLETQISANQDVLNRSKAQRILDKQAAYAEEKGIPLDEAISILNSEEFLNEKTIEKLEDLTKLLTSMAQESQKDVKAYDDAGATQKQKELISFMRKVSLDSLTNEEKKRYIRFSNNLLANGATFGMEQFQSIALGQEAAIKAVKDKRLSNKLAAWISPIGGDKAIDTARRIALRTQSEADTFKNIFGREAVGAFRNILGLNRLDVAQTDSNRAKEKIANEFGEYFKGLRKKYGDDATGFEAKGYAGIAGYLIQTDGIKTEAESIPYRRRLMEQNIAELRKSDRQTDLAEADLKERALAQLTGTTNAEILSQLRALNPASYEQLMWVKDVMLPKWRDFLKEHDENFRNQANNYNNPDHLTITYKFPEGQLLPNEIEDVYQQDAIGMRIKQAANSIKRKEHANLPVSPRTGTVANIDINFGYNQYNALVDQVDKAFVAPAWEQVVSFTKAPEFEQIMGGRANSLFVKKLLTDIQTSRTRQSMTDDEAQMVAGGVRLARKISTQAVLGGITQPLRQIPDQLTKLFFTTGRVDLITKNLLTTAEAAPLLNKFPIGRRGDAQAGTQYASQFSELARKVEASVTDRKWAQYRELMNRVGEFWMAPLRGSDVWAAKVSWMSYYEAELNKKGIKMESWEREAELVDTDQDRKEAASYAEFAVDFYGGASDPTKMASLSKQTNNGWKEFAKLVFLPLNSFALQQKNSLISDLRDAYLRTGDRKASIAAIAGTLAGMAAFHGMRIYIIGGLVYPAGKALLMGIFGIDMEEPDEEEKQKKLEDDWRKFKASMYGNIIAGGAGEFAEKAAIDAVNKATYLIQANVNPDEILDDKGEVMSFRQYEKDVSPLYRFRSFGSSEYSFGLADVLTEQAQRSLTETQQIMTSEEMERYTGNEQAYAMFSTMVEWLYFFRLMDTDVTRIARDLKRQMDKGVEEREKEIKAIRSGR